MAYIYLIKSLKVNWVYVGSTENLEKRIKQHNAGQVTSTKGRKPYALIHIEKYKTIGEARGREHEIKRSRILKEFILRSKIKALSSIG